MFNEIIIHKIILKVNRVIRLPGVIQLIQIIWLLKLNFGHIMIGLDEIFLNTFKIILIELKFILLYCINRINPGHLMDHDSYA